MSLKKWLGYALIVLPLTLIFAPIFVLIVLESNGLVLIPFVMIWLMGLGFKLIED